MIIIASQTAVKVIKNGVRRFIFLLMMLNLVLLLAFRIRRVV